jgi:hypothetical protein
MRKLLFLAVAALLTVVIAAPVFAAETTMTGSYRVRGVSDWNWDKAPNGDDLYTGYFDQRFRLTITHKRSEFLKAVVSIDLVEDTWGQQRNFRMNDSNGSSNGQVNLAYIEAITKVGLFRLGMDQTSRFGMGTWSDSGFNAGEKGNPGITWGIKIDNFVATATYVKYVDLIDPVFANAAGAPATYFRVWPGRGTVDAIGGDGSEQRNADLNTYVLTAHYISDNYKAGFLYQLIRDPDVDSAPFLVNGLSDSTSFAGESAFASNYLYRNDGAGYGANALFPVWPTPQAAPVVFGPFNVWPGAPGINNGVGRAGMYSAFLHIAAMYIDLKFLDGKLRFKGEYDRIWGTGDRNSRGDAYNAWLNGLALGNPLTTNLVTNLNPALRLPGDIKIDGHTVYADLSYDFDVAKVGVAFLYGSGEKHWRAFTQHHYNFNTTGNDDFKWGNIIVNGDGGFLGDASGGPLGLGSNPENVTSVKLYWSVDPMEKLDIHGAFIWAKYTQPVGRYAGGVTTGTQPFYGHPMNYLNPRGNVYIPVAESNELGWEIDAGATYEIMEGLSLNSEFGVLFTGDAFDYTNASGVHEWGPIYRWVNTLTYEF